MATEALAVFSLSLLQHAGASPCIFPCCLGTHAFRRGPHDAGWLSRPWARVISPLNGLAAVRLAKGDNVGSRLRPLGELAGPGVVVLIPRHLRVMLGACQRPENSSSAEQIRRTPLGCLCSLLRLRLQRSRPSERRLGTHGRCNRLRVLPLHPQGALIWLRGRAMHIGQVVG